MRKTPAKPFQLSPQYQFIEKAAIEQIALAELVEEQVPYILFDTHSEDELLLNSAIYTFLRTRPAQS